MIDDRTRLLHIRGSIDHALEFTAEGRDAFFADAKTQHAVVRALEVIGEAVKGISEPIQEAHPEVPWRQIAAMRDRLIHGYFTVDLKIVWSVVENELRPLRQKVETILQQLPPDPGPTSDGNS
jgi:uncharacterized protein with HEPN domain